MTITFATQIQRENMTSSRQWLLMACLVFATLLSRPMVATGDSLSAPRHFVPQERALGSTNLSDYIGKQDDAEIEVTGQQKGEVEQEEPPEEEDADGGSPQQDEGQPEAPPEEDDGDGGGPPQQEGQPEEPPEEDGDSGGPPQQEGQPEGADGEGDNVSEQEPNDPNDTGDADVGNAPPQDGKGEGDPTESPPETDPPTEAVTDPPTEAETDPPTEASPPETEPPTEPPPPENEPTESPPTQAPPTEGPPPEETEPPTDAPAPETEPPSEAPPPDTPSPTMPEPEETPAPTRPEPEETPAPTEPEPVETPAPTTEETPEPTGRPTASPTRPPVTDFPTSSPTVPPTDAPSSVPTPISDPSIMIQDVASVIIKPVSGVMSAGNAEHFQATATMFLTDLLIQLEQPIYDVEVTVSGGNILARQRRLQSDSMQVDMLISGSFDPVPGLAETADDYSIGRVSRQFFTVQGDNFVQMLQETDNDEDASYFASVTNVESVADPDDEANPAGTPESPGPAPTTGNGPGLAIGGIVAVALVGALVVALGAAFLVTSMRKRRRNNPSTRSRREKKASSKEKSSEKIKSKKSGSSKGSSARQRSGSAPTSPEKALDDVPPPVLSIGGPPSERGSIRRVDSDVNSDLQWGAESLIGAESNMSYAYSLEDGIRLSPSGESSLGYSIGLDKDSEHDSKGKSSIPAEIPNVSSSASKNDDDDDLDIDKSWTPNSSSIIREITAPAGKLGVVLNTSAKGPVVQSIAPGSPLEGMVWPGDVLISIDGMKTSKMSAASVTEYMSKNLFKPRNLTMMSDPDA